MLAQMKQGSLKELFAKQPIVEEHLKILFPQKSSHVSTCWYKSCRPWTWSPTISSGQRSEHEADQMQNKRKGMCGHLAPLECLWQQGQAGSGLRKYERDGKNKKDSLWVCVRVWACVLKAKEMICEVIKMSLSADGSPLQSSLYLYFHQYLIPTNV